MVSVNNKSEEKTTTTRVLRKRVISESLNAEEKITKCKQASSMKVSNKKKKNSADPGHEDSIVGKSKSAEGASRKKLKTLYTLDNGNWSDLIDENDEVTQPDMHTRANSIVVNHDKETIGDIEGVKTTYCSARRFSSREPKVISILRLVRPESPYILHLLFHTAPNLLLRCNVAA